MQYPELLTPTTVENIKLPSGTSVQIPKAEVVFELWTGRPVSDRYGNKPILNSNGEPAFAELAILKILQNDGWQGVWVDTYRNKYRTAYFPKDEVELPAEQRKLLLDIYGRAGTSKGCWDVFCWRDDVQHLFAESKRQGRDRIRDTQRRWLEAAIKCSLPLASFLVVEWTV
jgi:hypothetical protein